MQEIKYSDIKVGDIIMVYYKGVGYLISEVVMFPSNNLGFNGDMIGVFHHGDFFESRGEGSGALKEDAEFFKLEI